MKKSLFILAICLNIGFLFTNCNKDENILPQDENAALSASSNRVANNDWFRYDETRCSNPWKTDWLMEPTSQQLKANVSSYLVGLEIIVEEIRLIHDKVQLNCLSCTCTNGINYYVKASREEDMEKLLQMGFYRVTTVPEETITENNM